ncbi:putative low-specificity L-threonine aldolase [Colletotrichum aenigma]|uniref:putative low-specificity L-threonine aldolase n=1 Tax=Colletotrichum aenigma TaxID=1215731 RepID=UPI001872697E|nr:putative low-specificity L-threonine aldolase [Colletotrichum aenigma]KAF5525795.1 putative low-specificity L-threonine aldolase [Colletotrichum aenigma]
MSSTKNDELMAFSPALMAKWEAAADKASRDFRSDVVTVPTPDMMQGTSKAILEATVNDDIYDVDGDPSVKALEARLVELTGKEAALWAISGTQGNQICLRTHLTQPPHTVLLDYRAHVHCWESGALPVMSQASATTVHPKNGFHLTLDDVKPNMIADGNIHFPPTRVVSLENTLSGTILPLKGAQAISEYVRSFPVPEGQKPVAMHLDAARLFDGVIGEGVDLKAYAACFDSLSICLAKGIGAPMGSVILGSKQFIERAKWFRKMFGGGTRQPGMMAAAALEALNYTLPRMSKVHALTKATAAKIEELGYKFALPVQTNMIVLDLAAVDIPAAAFVDYCAKRRLAVFPNGRVVLHHQSTSEATDALVTALTELMRDKSDGKALSNAEVHGGYS